MNRRGFLSGLITIAAAPAIVRAESLMKIWVPPTQIIVPNETLAMAKRMYPVFANSRVMPLHGEVLRATSYMGPMHSYSVNEHLLDFIRKFEPRFPDMYFQSPRPTSNS